MTDITICINDDCPLSDVCWRYNFPPKKYNQSYALFEYTINENEDCECSYYEPIEENQ